MPNLMERKSTRRVENAAAQPTSVREQVRQWATNLASETSTANCVCWEYTCAFEGSTWTGSEVARRGVGREDTFIEANGLILETHQSIPQETERIAEFWLCS
jgi:hypothetical protein